MKNIIRKKIRRIAKTAWIALLALAMFSCTNGTEGTSAIETKGRLSITAKNTTEDSRTILAETPELDEMSYTLECVREAEDAEGSTGGSEQPAAKAGENADAEAKPATTKLSWENYSAMKEDETILLDTGKWTFTLTAKKGDVVLYTATETKTIATGDNPISFTLMEVSDGDGIANVTVTFPDNAGVAKVDATLLASDWKDMENFPAKTIWQAGEAKNGESDEENATDKLSATYKQDKIPNGNYVLVFKFYRADGSEIAPGYSEIIKIRAGRTSSKTIDIKSLEKLHSIAYRNIEIGELPNGAKTTFNEYERVTLPTEITRTGYTFSGWFEKNAETKTEEIPVGTTEDKTFYAKWTANTYTVKFNANFDGYDASKNGAMEVQTFTYDVEQALTANKFTRTGYTFAGWAKTADGEKAHNDSAKVKNLTDTNSGEVTLYAKWTAIPYSITYNTNDGENSAENPATYTVESEEITLKDPAKTGYTFGEWFDNEKCDGEKVTKIAKGSMGEKSFWANWTANEYTVKFDANGGTGTMTDQAFKYDVEQALTANKFTRTGYTFAGWAKTADGEKVYDNNSPESNLTATNNGTVTLYAKWTPYTYTVKFNANFDGYNADTNKTMADQTFTYDVEQALTPNAFERENYAFAGWATEPDGEKVYADGYAVPNLTDENNGTVNLYAKWGSPTTVTATIVKGDINVRQSGSYIYADSGYDTYKWYVDGVLQSNTSYSFSFYTSGKKPGIYEVVVIAVKDGIPYSAQINVKVK